METRLCYKCLSTKTIDKFSPKQTWCKECCNEYAKEYRKKNKDLISEKNKQYYENGHKEKKKEYDASRLEIVAARDRERYKTDINFRMKKIIRTRLSKVLKDPKKSYSIADILGVSVDTFKVWIEYQFDDNMTWDNQGTYWDIDHVISCSSFDLSKDDEINICFNWSNMRPLHKTENYKKWIYVDIKTIEQHSIIISNFMAFNQGINPKWKHFGGMEINHDMIKNLQIG